MRRAAVAFGFALAVAGAVTARGDSGPVKHWGTFPGGEVRSVAIRGDAFGGERYYSAVQGRDGFVYVRGRLGLYRVLDDEGRNERIARTSECSGLFESQGVDDRRPVPLAICDRAADIIAIVSPARHEHVRVPAPAWEGSIRYAYGARLDNRYLTSVVSAAGGGYWYGFAAPGAVGRVWPSGRAETRRILGLGMVTGIATAGSDLYVADDACHVAHLRGLTPVVVRIYSCRHDVRSTIVARTTDGAAWVLNESDHVVERFAPDGTQRHWVLSVTPTAVAVTSNGTAYVLGRTSDEWRGHPAIAVIARGHAPEARVLPMLNADGIAADARDRLWIGTADDHAFAVITPKGARG